MFVCFCLFVYLFYVGSLRSRGAQPCPIGAFHASLPARHGDGKRCRAFELLEIGYYN